MACEKCEPFDKVKICKQDKRFTPHTDSALRESHIDYRSNACDNNMEKREIWGVW